MNKIKETLKKLNIFDYFILLSPFIDLITSQAAYKSESTLTLGMIVRFGFLAIMLLYLIFKNKSKYKKKSIIYIAILITFGIINLTNSYFLKGSSVMIEEIKYMIKAFYFPIMLVISLNYFDNKKTKVNDKVLYITGMVYAILMVLAFIINKPFGMEYIGIYFYPGWFFAANETGAIIGILAPIILYLTIKNYKKWYVYPLFIIHVFSSLILATSAPVLGIFISVISFLVMYVLKYIFNKKKIKIEKNKLIPIIIISIVVGLFLTDFVIKSYSIKGLTKEEVIHVVFNYREKHNEIVLKKFKQSNLKEKYIGLGYIDQNKKYDRQTNNVEIDFLDIFYPYGLIGFIIYYFVLFKMLINILKIFIKNFKNIINNDKVICYITSICILIGLAFFAGHTFLAPPVSLFTSIIIAISYIKISECN